MDVEFTHEETEAATEEGVSDDASPEEAFEQSNTPESVGDSYPLITVSDLHDEDNHNLWERIVASLPEAYRIPDMAFLSILASDVRDESS